MPRFYIIFSGQTKESTMDFNKTRFKDKTFTKIFRIKTICYACNKQDFLKGCADF